MNKENKKRFEILYLKNTLEKYPSFTDIAYAIPKADTKEIGANSLTKLVISFLEFNNCQAERINSAGRYIDDTKQVIDCIGRQRTIGSGKFIKSTSTNGTADISAVIKGRSIKIEIKWDKDRQSTNQKIYQQSIEKAGGIYIIVKTFDDFINWYDDFESTFLF